MLTTHLTGSVDSPEDSTIEYPASSSHGRLQIRTRCDGLTDRGRRRSNNEDSFLIARLTKRLDVCRSSFEPPGSQREAREVAHLLVVADGLGGAAAGEQASSLSIATVEDFVLNCFKWFLHFEPGEQDELIRELRQALERADREVYRRAQADRALAGMGTTLTMAYTVRGELYLAHAGDSRAYLFRDGALRRITRDHSYAQMLLDAGHLSPEDARLPGIRNVVTNVVGGPREGVHAEIHKLSLEDGDALLLCTDGLSEPVDEPTIASLIAEHDDPSACCRALLSRALDAGGPDNVSLILARFGIARG
ncbi:PP2C family protein-serine/threonine phosphatase [Tautonia sociabilis]|uniref:Serine/threonine-protein phosphatase n=1 Tax=Tautonia sociabilis TaxID=2080755 RepID=A0A432MJZ3_9BACT|nr:protein phosphatase 2C domain-containing protein [Tautonia sociabilis]RUL87734.1 serine/threonine-protein phosphatase [Tautonia sociabilis]